MSSPPSIALVTCVRNEARFLPAFLAYHRVLGVSRAYVYLDRCTDSSRAILERHDWVEVVERDQTDGPAQLAFHQMQCADDALLRARAAGYDWLLMLDVDEFAWGGATLPSAHARWLWWPGRRRLHQRGSLARLAAAAAPETDMILLRTAEVVVEQGAGVAAFWKLHTFQVEGVLRRPLLDPVQQTVRTLERWIGHRLGKALVRTERDVQAFDSHGWTRRQGVAVPEPLPLRTEERGWLLHYVVTSPEHWRQKYRQLAQEPAHWLRGEPVEFPKQAWKEAARVMDEAAARDYFDRWVAVPPALVRAARRRGGVRTVTVVEDLLKLNRPRGDE